MKYLTRDVSTEGKTKCVSKVNSLEIFGRSCFVKKTKKSKKLIEKEDNRFPKKETECGRTLTQSSLFPF